MCVLHQVASATQLHRQTDMSRMTYHVGVNKLKTSPQGFPFLVSLPSSVLPKNQTQVLQIRSKVLCQRASLPVVIVWISVMLLYKFYSTIEKETVHPCLA
jgi:hypothetical protein